LFSSVIVVPLLKSTELAGKLKISFYKIYSFNYLKRGSLTSFYRQRTSNRRVHAHHIHQQTATTPPPPPPPRLLLTPPCPSKSLKCLDDQLYRQDSDVAISPQIARHDVYLKEPLR